MAAAHCQPSLALRRRVRESAPALEPRPATVLALRVGRHGAGMRYYNLAQTCAVSRRLSAQLDLAGLVGSAADSGAGGPGGAGRGRAGPYSSERVRGAAAPTGPGFLVREGCAPRLDPERLCRATRLGSRGAVGGSPLPDFLSKNPPPAEGARKLCGGRPVGVALRLPRARQVDSASRELP
jgi:hypothetical protein